MTPLPVTDRGGGAAGGDMLDLAIARGRMLPNDLFVRIRAGFRTEGGAAAARGGKA